MHDSIVLKIPSDIACMSLVEHVITGMCTIHCLSQEDLQALIKSTEELIANAVAHAYKDETGYIEISLHPFKTGMRIDVHDWGIPMSYKKHSSVPLIRGEAHGFKRIYDLMDVFEYHNLGKDGKKFVIIKYASHALHCAFIPSNMPHTEPDEEKTVDPNIPVKIREFQEGDEEGIARLIYKNYGYSYVKDLFYYSDKILEFHGKKFYSVVAEAEGKIIGHFAFLLVPDSTVGEVGIVVVDPLFKGRGIMNQMMDLLLKKAESIGLDAVFGEAIMYHTFSQKSNLSHGFSESAFMLGKMSEALTIENNELTKSYKRGSVLVGYKFFHKRKKKLYLPEVYQTQIEKTYKEAGVPFEEKKRKKTKSPAHVFLNYAFDPPSNIGKIRVDAYGKDFNQKFLHLVSQLRSKHCDMIYVDVSLERIPKIDKVIKIINKRGFFYSGVMFFIHDQGDYLRLQLKHSDKIGTKNYVCHSEFCKALISYVKEDEKRCKEVK